MASRRPPESMASPPINHESEGALEWTPPVLLSAVKVRSMRRKKSKHPGTVRLELQQKLKASRKSRSAKLHRNHFRFASVCKNLRKPTPRINVQGSSHSSSSRLTSSIARLSFFLRAPHFLRHAIKDIIETARSDADAADQADHWGE